MSASADPTAGEEPILEALSEFGYEVNSLADLRHMGKRYRDAVPVLLSGLERTFDPKLKGEIVRALSVPWAKPSAVMPLIEEFKLADDPAGTSLRWVIGNALEVIWDDTHYDELVTLAVEERYGKAREMLVLGLGRSKRPEAGDVLIELLEDPEVNGHAVKALGKLKIQRARPGLERMSSDGRAWVRKAAIAALKKLEPS